MHELGMVFHTIKTVNALAKENNLTHIDKLVMEIGEVSGIINYYFEDCYFWAVRKEPLLMNSTLEIETVKAITTCNHCHKEYPTVQYGKTCPYCQSEDTVLKCGNEINIKQIEVKED